MRTTLGLLFLLVLLGCGGSATKLQTTTVQRGTFQETVEATGTLASTNSIFVGCPKVEDMWEFQISFMATEGQDVKKGDPILEFDSKQLMEQLQSKEATLASERKSLEKIVLEENETYATLVLEDQERGLDVAKAWRMVDVPVELSNRLDLEKLSHDHELAKAQKEMSAAKVILQRENQANKIKTQENNIKNLQAEVDTLRAAIESLTVSAPKDGLVVIVENWRREKPAVGDQVYFGSGLMELPDLAQMQVEATIDEPDAGRVMLGQTVEVRLDASPDRLFMGKVSSLGKIFHQKSYDKPSVVFDAEISLDTPDPTIMRPGMAAKVRILQSSAQQVLLVSEDAILYEEEQPHVLLENGIGGPERRNVKLGRSANGKVEVLEGLEEGDVVVLPDSIEGGVS